MVDTSQEHIHIQNNDTKPIPLLSASAEIIKKAKTLPKKITSKHALFLFLFLLAGAMTLPAFLYESKLYMSNFDYGSESENQNLKTWTSEHLLDCQTIALVKDNTDSQRSSIFVTTTTDPSFEMSIYDPKSDYVSGFIHRDGCWECDLLKKMLHALSSYPDSYFLDIGGNIGMWTLAAANVQKETFTFEPLKENYSRFCESVNKNSFNDRVHLLTIAATQTEQVFRLKIPRKNMGGTSVVPVTADDAEKVSRDGVNIIKGVSIDSLNLPTDRPVVMKMDVEGHELQALLGALEFMREADIVHLSIEHRTAKLQEQRDKWLAVFKLLSSKGLVPFRADPGKDTELDPNNLDEWKHFSHPRPRHFDVIWKRNKV